MSRRPVWIAIALVTLASCSGPAREAPPPPPITAKAPSPSPVPPQATSSSLPETQRAAVEERVTDTPLPVSPVATPSPEPSGEPGVPPPSRIIDASNAPEAPPVDPLRAMQDSQARKEDYRRRLERLATAVEDSRALVERRERDLLAFKNPFLPRPQLSPDDAKAIEGMGGAARAKWAEDRLAEANLAFQTAQKAYDDAKANPPLN